MESNGTHTRALLLALLASLIVVISTVAYALELSNLAIPTPGKVSMLTQFSEVYFLLVLVCIAVSVGAVRSYLSSRAKEIRAMGRAPLSPGWIIPYVISTKKYRRIFLISAAAYLVFYAVITSMVVVQPTVDFASAYGVAVPSVQITPLMSGPFLSPLVTVYLGSHVGLLLIPLTVILLLATSILVGLNFALAGFAFDSRVAGVGRGWVSGVGAVVGLFTGCPTCAGLFFANFLGGASAVSFATLLGYYQPAFILLSLPVLAVAPYLTSRSLSKVYRDGCVFLPDAMRPSTQ